jgi:hypothetical protein
MVIELIKSKAFQDLLLWIEQLDVKDPMVTAVPDLVILEETRRLFFSYLNIQQVSNPLGCKGDEIRVAQKRKEADEESNEKERESDSIETNPPRFKGGDLAVSREHTEGKKGGEEDRIGKAPLEDYFRDLIEKVFEDQVVRCLVFSEKIHLLAEENHDIDEDQTTQA